MKYSITLLVLFVILGCNNSENIFSLKNQVENIVIDVDKNRYLPFDSIFDKTEYVKLETRDDNLIGNISHLFFEDSLLIVVDSENAKAIYVFDTDGKFKHAIGERGNGPKEFVEISNVCIVPDKKILCVLDRPQSKILFFDFNGDFIELEDYTFVMIATPWSYPFAVYSHRDQEAFLTSGEFNNPLYPLITNKVPITRYKENGLVYQMDAHALINIKKELYKRSDYRDMLDGLTKDLQYDSNPVLLIFHLRINYFPDIKKT